MCNNNFVYLNFILDVYFKVSSNRDIFFREVSLNGCSRSRVESQYLPLTGMVML